MPLIFRYPITTGTTAQWIEIGAQTSTITQPTWTYRGGSTLGIYYNPNALTPIREPEPESAARRIERQRAVERAELLLLESLSAHQLQEYRDRGTFVVAHPGPPPRLFRLQKRRVANIVELDARGLPAARYCVHPRLDCPDADTMLSQKLWLENRPQELLDLANRHPV